LDPENILTYLWMYYSYREDLIEQSKKDKDYAVFLGSFANPSMARKILDQEKNTIEMDDEQFDKIMETLDQTPLVPIKKKALKLAKLAKEQRKRRRFSNSNN